MDWPGLGLVSLGLCSTLGLGWAIAALSGHVGWGALFVGGIALWQMCINRTGA